MCVMTPSSELYTKGLEPIVAFSPEERLRLQGELNNIASSYTALAEQLRVLLGDDASRVLGVLVSLTETGAAADPALVRAAARLAAPSDGTFADFLTQLLRSPAIRAVSNAARVMLDNDRNYASAASISNVRYLFDDDAQKLSGAVIVTSIRINYWEGEGRGSVSIACDPDDLHELRAVVDRAIQKVERLEVHLVEEDDVNMEPFDRGEGTDASNA